MILSILKRLGVTLVVVLLVLLLYTFLHELGHALAGILQGGKIAQFSINFLDFSAHAAIDGEFSDSQQVLINLSGFALPVLAWLIFLLLAPRVSDPVLELFKLVSSACIFGTVLPWMIIPILSFSGQAPANDDVTLFLGNSGINPWLASGLFLALLAAFIWFYSRRIEGLRSLPGIFKRNDLTNSPTARHTAITLTGITAAGLLVGAVLGGFEPRQAAGPSTVIPPGYGITAEIDLNQGDQNAVILTSFPLKEQNLVGFHFILKDFNTPYLDISLVRPGIDQVVLLHGEKYFSSLDVVNKELVLPSGEYQLILNSRRSLGTLKVYFLPPK